MDGRHPGQAQLVSGSVNISSELQESIAAGWAGGDGSDWLDRLPTRIAEAEQRWQIAIGPPFEPGGYTSFVAPATPSTGDAVVYKITIPHTEAIGEADALAAYAGDGAVQVLASEPDLFESLLERCSPGYSLWSVAADDERLDTACALMARLWRPLTSDAFADLGTVATEWADVTSRRLITCGYPWPSESIERGIDLLRTLPRQATDRVLLHGDFHPGNILRAEREPWLVIDPKPMIGDAAFDPVQLLTQHSGAIAEPERPAAVEDRLIGIAERVGLDAERIGLWAIARTAEWSLWSWEHGNTVEAARYHAWTRMLDVVIPEL